MKCPICGKRLSLYGERCSDCGYRVPDSEDYSPDEEREINEFLMSLNKSPYYEPPNKTSRFKGCCCAALVIIPLLLILVGAIVFGISIVTHQATTEEHAYYEDAPSHAVPESLPAEAAEGAFSIQDGAVTFLPHEWEGGRVLRVPETVDGQTVTALAHGCFQNCTELTTIILPGTVTDIGMKAFAGCTGLRGLALPAGIEVIRADAFEGCVNLEALYVPDSVNHFAGGCMDDCASLMYIFYDDTYEGWHQLYDDFITPFTTVICTNGSFLHGSNG